MYACHHASVRQAAAALFAPLLVSLLLSSPVEARKMALPQEEIVNVNVNFNSQSPISDLSEEAITKVRNEASRVLYEMAKKECALMLEVIAETCKLTNLNVSTQVQNYNNQAPMQIYINSSANFAITLKRESVNE